MTAIQEQDWNYYSQSLCTLIPRSKLEPDAVDFINQNRSLGLCCSGGMDSVCLLLLIHSHFGPSHRIVVLHYNHNTRGEENNVDEFFVKTLATSLNLVFFSEKRENTQNSSEKILRQDRYDFFLRAIRSFDCSCLVLGHHMDDLIESMLMRLAKGYGPRALASPQAVQRFADHVRVRPLLNTRRSFIEKSLKSIGIPWREDPSNGTDLYLRNRLRSCIKRNFDEIFQDRDWRSGFAMARHLMAEDSEALDQILVASAVSTDAKMLNLHEIRSMPRAIIRRILSLWLVNNNLVAMASFKHLSNIIDWVINREAKTIGCADNRSIEIQNDWIVIRQLDKPERPREFMFGNWLHGDLYLPSGVLKRRKIHVHDGALATDDNTIARLSMDGNAKLIVRNWNHGDRYIPFGLAGYKKLKKCFCERKISVNVRKILPVVTNGSGEILWVPGLPVSNDARIKFNDKLALELTFLRR